MRMPVLSSSSGATKGPATAPTIGTATAADVSASVTFTAPSFSKLPITSYTVTASPGGATGTGASSPITVSGLTNGTPYTFSVRASHANGQSAASSASNSASPVAPRVAPAGYTYSASAGKWYKLYPSTGNWATANTTVTNEGGWLAVPKSGAQNSAVKSASGSLSVWLGLGDPDSTYTYTIRASLHPNFGATSFVYQNFGGGQPDTSPAFAAQLGSNGSWLSATATTTFRYVGEWF
jgi:hypothetical protein